MRKSWTFKIWVFKKWKKKKIFDVELEIWNPNDKMSSPNSTQNIILKINLDKNSSFLERKYDEKSLNYY